MKLKNKILSAIMIVAASMTLVSMSAFAATVGYNPSNIEVKAGEEFTVELVTADVEDLCSVGFYVTGSNETFTLINAEDTALYPDPVHSQSTAIKNFYFSWNLDGTFSTGSDVSGVVAKLTYKVNADVTPGNYTIDIASDENATFDLNEEDPFTTLNKLNVTVVKDEPTTKTVGAKAKMNAPKRFADIQGVLVTATNKAGNAGEALVKKADIFGEVAELNAEVVMGLNINNVPADEELTGVTMAWAY